MKKILSFTYTRTIILGIFFAIPFLFGGQAKAATPFTTWAVPADPMTSCGEITISGTYTVSGSFDNDSLDPSGNCFIVAANNVTIDGGGHTITGNIKSTDISSYLGSNFTVQNATVVGNITSSDGMSGNDYGFEGISGVNITLQNIVFTGSITSGNGGSGNNISAGDNRWGGNGGEINITDSVLSDSTITSGNGGNGGLTDGSGSGQTNGGEGGRIHITNSTTTSTVAFITGNGGNGADSSASVGGGDGGRVYLSLDSVLSNATSFTFTFGTGGLAGTNSENPATNGSNGSIICGISTPGVVNINADIAACGRIDISSDGVIIDGNGHTVNVNISGINGASFTVQNAIVTGTITSDSGGSSGDPAPYGTPAHGGSITILNSTTTSITSGNGGGGFGGGSGGDITISDSRVTDITSGNGGDGGQNGGNGGSVTLTNTIYKSITLGTGGTSDSGNFNPGQAGVLTSNNSFAAVTSCQTISSAGVYRLSSGIGSGGDCIVINANDVIIDGNGHTVTGNINGDSNNYGAPGYSFELRNITVTGNVRANGADTSNDGCLGSSGSGGNITISTSTIHEMYSNAGGSCSISAGNGGNINILSSTVTTITAKGTDYGETGNSSNGGNGGNVNATNTLLLGLVDVEASRGGSFGSSGSSGTVHIYSTPHSISQCQTLYSSGTYTLSDDLDGDDCLFIQADDVIVDGGGHTINGNIHGDSMTIGGRGYTYELYNAVTPRIITANGKSSDNSGVTSKAETGLNIKGPVYINDTYIGTPISACQTISTAGTYTLTKDIGSGGDCLRITINDVTVRGNGHVITGNVNGDSTVSADASPTLAHGNNFTLENIAVLGNATSNGGTNNNNYCNTGGNGGTITISSSTINDVYVNGGDGYDYQGCNPPGGAGGTINIVSPSNTGTLHFSAGGPGPGGQVGQFTGYAGNNSNDYGSNLLNGGNGGSITVTGTSIDLYGASISAIGGSGRNGSLTGLNGTFSVGKNTSPYTTLSHSGTVLSALAHLVVYGSGSANLGDLGAYAGGSFPTIPGVPIMSASECDLNYPGTYYLGANITGNCSVNTNGVVIDGAGLYTIHGNIIGVGDGVLRGRNFNVQNVTVTGNISSVSSGNSGGTVVIATSTVNTVTVTGKNAYSSISGTVTLLNSTANSVVVNGAGATNDQGGIINLTNSTSTVVRADGGGKSAFGGSITLTNSKASTISASAGDWQRGGSVTITGSLIDLSNTAISVYGVTRGTVTLNFTTINHASTTFSSSVNSLRINGPSNVGQNLGDTGEYLNTAFPTLPNETAMTPTQCKFYFTGTYKLGADIAGCSVYHDSVIINAQNHTISGGISGGGRSFTLNNATTTGTIRAANLTVASSTIDIINVNAATGGSVTLTNSHANNISAKGTAGNGGTVTMNGVPNLNIASATVDTDGTATDGTAHINFTNASTNINTFFLNASDLVVNSVSLGAWNTVYNPTIYYFNSEASGAGHDGDWNNPLNWWYNSSATIPFNGVPDGTNSVEIYSNISTSTAVATTSAYFITFHGTSTNSITINAVTGVIFNDESGNTAIGHIIGQAVFNGGASNAGLVTGLATFNASSTNIGVVINTATTTFNGNLASSSGLVTDAQGGTSTPITRIFTQVVTTTRNFITEAGHNNWVLVAQGVAVNITNAVYDTATNLFKALFGGTFITGGTSVVPQIVINSPTTGTNNKWVPSINWDTASGGMCEYRFEGNASSSEGYSTLDCSKNGSDIPRPSAGSHTLYIRGTDVRGNTTETPGRTFIYDNTKATYTFCGTDLLDEPLRPYYYLQGNVIGDCKATVNTELHGNISNLTTGYTVSGNIVATTTGDAVSVILRNITVSGDVHAEGITDGANGATTSILFSNVGNVFTSGATSTIGKGGNSGSVNISYSTTTAIVANAGQSVGAAYGTVGDIIIGKSKILGPILASGNTNGGSAGLISIATSTTYNIVANGGNGTAKGGNGGTINITSTLGVASSTISINGGDATVCGRGGNSGTVTFKRSSYGRVTANAGSDFSGLCPAYTNGSSGSGGDSYVVSDGLGYSSGDSGGSDGGADAGQNQQSTGSSSVGPGGIFSVLPSVAVIGKLNLKPLPVFGETMGTSKGNNSFSFIDNLNQYLFKLLPSTGDKTLDAYLASRGLIHEQDLVALRKKSIQISSKDDVPGIFTVSTSIMPVKTDTGFTTTTTAPLATYLSSSKASPLTETVTAFSGSTLTIAFTPIGKEKVAGTFNKKPVDLVKTGKTLTTTITLPTIPGTYTFTTPQSPLPLTIIIPRPKIVAVQPAPTQSFWSMLRNIF